MRRLLTTIILSTILVGCKESQTESASLASREDVVPADATPEEVALLNDVRKMFQQSDVSVMMKRVHKEGVDDWWMKVEKDYLDDVLEGGLGSLELVRIDPPRTEGSSFDGSVFRWSLPLKWELIIHEPSDGTAVNVSHTISLSEQDGRIVSIRQIDQGE
ncbi:hypothetical protein SAMN02745181_0497 [Rubritalea squalenifaciens DSM 18772]|uniref:Lipoprotein n=1 Tax=Rubritalea squalenifaciens DSM 18772 TaxID=1123071 RepID=A0A1M6CJS7_9BACT|nr:hypothetical protein [Rubritalea squalenifaciens]SHI61229.1 hypothetical protein SAMN02745181_0497 [Rubritalea squalenifaciens DSM 18772]